MINQVVQDDFYSSGWPLEDLTMVELSQRIPNFDREDDALSMILEGTAKVTGKLLPCTTRYEQ